MKGASLYIGEVRHARLRPARHQLSYRVFMGLFDIDALSETAQRLWSFGYNKRALISFHDKDHGDGSGRPLRAQIEAALAAHALALDGGAIRALCMPRVLNYVFNPITTYFCYGADEALRAIVHEVNNTFGERHLYVLPASSDAQGGVSQACAKTFRVSPFLPLGLRYNFRIHPPGEAVSVAIVVSDEQGPVLTASFKGARRPFTNSAIARAYLAHPALTLKVFAGIHWEALWIWLKLKRVDTRPAAVPHAPSAVR